MENEFENIVMVCEDSLDGIFTGIYEAYEKKLPLSRTWLQIGEEDNIRLFTTYIEVKPNQEKAMKVVRTLKQRLGEDDYFTLCMALSSPSPDKAQAVFRTVVWGLKEKQCRSVMEHLTDDYIRRVLELSRNAGNELQHLKGFLRFHELEGDILYSVISPSNDLLPLLAIHFTDRLPKEDFVIFDEGRKLYAVHPSGRDWFMMKDCPETEAIGQMAMTKEEEYYQDLFRHFVKCISIEARANYQLQRNMLPIHFRKYMVEFNQSKTDRYTVKNVG